MVSVHDTWNRRLLSAVALCKWVAIMCGDIVPEGGKDGRGGSSGESWTGWGFGDGDGSPSHFYSRG